MNQLLYSIPFTRFHVPLILCIISSGNLRFMVTSNELCHLVACGMLMLRIGWKGQNSGQLIFSQSSLRYIK